VLILRLLIGHVPDVYPATTAGLLYWFSLNRARAQFGYVTDLPVRQAGSTRGRSPGRLSLAGCVPAEPASVWPAGRIVLLVSIIVNLSFGFLPRPACPAGPGAPGLTPGLPGLSGGGEFGVSARQDGFGPAGKLVGRGRLPSMMIGEMGFQICNFGFQKDLQLPRPCGRQGGRRDLNFPSRFS
jgi:hypothetical protein